MPKKYFTDEERRNARKRTTAKYYATHRTQCDARNKAQRAKNPEPDRVRCRNYYANNREQCLARDHQYYLENAAKLREASRSYRQQNPTTVATSKAAYNATHGKERQGSRRTYYLSHQEEELAYTRNYIARHPEKNRANVRKYEAKKKGAPVCDLTHEQWLEIQAAQDHRCYYCGKRCKGKLTQDHITPLSKGGSHTLHNVIAACHSCNSRKGNRPPVIAIQPLLLTLAKNRPPKTRDSVPSLTL
jgi:5-methylcytosine-specific restriction endonuclease McrA